MRLEDASASDVRARGRSLFALFCPGRPGRVADSVETAFFEGGGRCQLWQSTDRDTATCLEFNDRFERDGRVFPEPSPDMFNFNSPVRACSTCEGYGHVLGINPDKVIPDPTKSLYDGAVAPWRGERTGRWRERMVMGAADADLPVHALARAVVGRAGFVWHGCAHFKGIHAFFATLEAKSYKIQNRVMISRYEAERSVGRAMARVWAKTHNVFIGQTTLPQLLSMSIEEALETMQRGNCRRNKPRLPNGCFGKLKRGCAVSRTWDWVT